MTQLELALKVAWTYVGKFYKWGGDDPSGFDCSGLCIEILKSAGLLPRKFDTTAHGLSNKFNEVTKPVAGCLIFWGSPRITHVEFCIDENHTIGASGGGSKTITEADAIRHNAYVKVRPIREGYSKIVNPFI
jgi:cell wall-associated NlpC family hydrolase